MAFPFLTIFMAFIIFLAVRQATIKKHRQDAEDAFWEKEAEANVKLAVNLDDLCYITIPLEKFPLGFSNDSEILAMENRLQELSTMRILNLTNVTNTDVKLTYGVPNFDKVTSYGDNFDELTLLLKNYALSLIDHQMIAEAMTVLEYGVGIGTDISQHYVLLGECYVTLDKTQKLTDLINLVDASSLVMKSSILRQLTALTEGSAEDAELVSSPEDFTT